MSPQTMPETNNNKTLVVLKSIVDTLECDDPVAALMDLSRTSKERAKHLSRELQQELNNLPLMMQNLPDLLKRLPNTQDADSHPVSTAIACSDSILHSLSKIASAGSQASQEIIQLEKEKKRDLEELAQDAERALRLRKTTDVAAQSLSAQRYQQASMAIQEYSLLLKKHRLTERASNWQCQTLACSMFADHTGGYVGVSTAVPPLLNTL
jgi:hypothetical protein